MRFEISASYAYALLRGLAKRGLVSIDEGYFSEGYGSSPRREWHYSLTLAGRRALNEWNEAEGEE
jgi:DNA-binding PadR family transcriptional regulator